VCGLVSERLGEEGYSALIRSGENKAATEVVISERRRVNCIPAVLRQPRLTTYTCAMRRNLSALDSNLQRTSSQRIELGTDFDFGKI
jgi:hypothetical protein